MNIIYKHIKFNFFFIFFFSFSSLVANMNLYMGLIPILAEHAQKNPPFFREFNVGIGGASNFGFASVETGNKIWVSAKDLMLNNNISDNSYYSKIKNFNGGSFQTLQAYLKKSKFFTIWITKGWKDSWYNLSKIQTLMDAGYIPVFNYWYFGDTLSGGFPNSQDIAEYRVDTQRVATLLGQLNGRKMLIMEPEFNKGTIMATTSTQKNFANILIKAIQTIRSENTNKLLVSLCMTDQGSRSIYKTDADCGYNNCALGDKDEWMKLNTIYSYILPHLDFISFYQIVGQFSRDYHNPGSWNSPNPRSVTAGEIGIDYLAQRISNLSKFLHDTYGKPIYMPYLAIPTATWSDTNSNNQIEDNEVSPDGWVGKAENVYRQLGQMKNTLKSNGLFGYATMELFDNPRHDYGGYQFLMNNTYHLGIIGSSAKDETDIAAYGDLRFKGTILNSIFNN